MLLQSFSGDMDIFPASNGKTKHNATEKFIEIIC